MSGKQRRCRAFPYNQFRIASVKDGAFVSYPATRNENTGKWWNHVYAVEGFSNAVLQEYNKGNKSVNKQVADDDIPF